MTRAVELSVVGLAPLLIQVSTFVGGVGSVMLVAPIWMVAFKGLVLDPLAGRRFAVPKDVAFAALVLLIIVTLASDVRWLATAPLTAAELVARSVRFMTPIVIVMMLVVRGVDGAARAAIIAGSVLFVLVNVGLSLAIGGSGVGTPSILGSIVGLNVERAALPLGGVNGFGGACGLALAMSLALFPSASWRMRVLLGGTIIAAAWGIVATDNRGALLALILGLATIGAWRVTRTRQVLSIGAAASLLVVPLSLAGVVMLGNAGTLARSETDVESWNGRTLIWQTCLTAIVDSPGMLVFGNGWNGAGPVVAHLFPPDDPDRAFHTAHNTMLQTIMDSGLIGAALLVLVAASALSRLAKDPTRSSRALLAGLLFLTFAGVLESHGTSEIGDTYLLTLLILAAGVATSRPSRSSPRLAVGDRAP